MSDTISVNEGPPNFDASFVTKFVIQSGPNVDFRGARFSLNMIIHNKQGSNVRTMYHTKLAIEAILPLDQ